MDEEPVADGGRLPAILDPFWGRVSRFVWWIEKRDRGTAFAHQAVESVGVARVPAKNPVLAQHSDAFGSARLSGVGQGGP
jgi:hypothetical protein